MLSPEIKDAIILELTELVSKSGHFQYAGRYCEQLCVNLSEICHSPHILLTSSGTAGVEIALRAAGISPGDRVLLSAYDYPGNFWAVERVGARPVLLDVEASGWRISVSAAEDVLDHSAPAKPRALIASHLHGQLQDAAALRSLCEKHGVLFVEDSCQAIGAQVGGRPAGNWGHVGIFSFGGGKVLSAGRGGALATSDPMLAQRMVIAAGAGSGPYAMSELQAATLLPQLNYLASTNEACVRYFASLAELLQTQEVCAPWVGNIANSAFYQAGFLLPSRHEATKPLQAKILQAFAQAGISGGSGFPGFHRRSTRRCEHGVPLRNTSTLVDRTWVLHHQVALDGQRNPRQLSELILPLLPSISGLP